MTCPRCGYARADFETYCLRCRLMDAQGVRPRPFVDLADQTIVMNDLPGGMLPPSRPRRSRVWLPVLLVLLTLLVGAAVWHLAVAARQTTQLSVGTNSPS